MNLSRRGLLGMLAVGVGAAIVRPGLIMPIKPKLVWFAPEWPGVMKLRCANGHAYLLDTSGSDLLLAMARARAEAFALNMEPVEFQGDPDATARVRREFRELAVGASTEHIFGDPRRTLFVSGLPVSHLPSLNYSVPGTSA